MSAGQKNIYHCEKCGREIVTIDIDDGTTPFTVGCKVTKGCDGWMRSAFYRVNPNKPHQYEWFKPNDLSKYDKEYVEGHLALGGLDLRRRQVGDAQISKDLLEAVRQMETVSIVWVQRKFKQTYMTAAKIFDGLILFGVVYPEKDSRGQCIVVQEVPWAGDR